ncbi:MAG TPA: peroxiredoxin-like family protein [Alphaproteobacteria bacterium]|nr:peroxiredoxin-like family protein [Alphaproteobacteria bacterium]
MSLQEKLSAFKAQFQSGKPPFERVPPGVHGIMKRATDELVASGIAERVPSGGPAPEFALTNSGGEIVRLADLIAAGPVALSFYRGIWCPYCNIDLKELELHAAQIRAMGATLVAITPQTPVNSRKSIAEHRLSFDILSDPANSVADRYGLRYRLPDYLIELYKQLGVDLPAFNGDGSWSLPVPARFVIDRQGQIRYAEAHPDYTVRPEPTALLAVLAGLRNPAVV